MGISIRYAVLEATAFAMAGEISPNMASAIAIPIGPTMICAFRQAVMTAFSHIARSDAVCSDCCDNRFRADLPDLLHKRPSHPSSLTVNDQYIHANPSCHLFFITSVQAETRDPHASINKNDSGGRRQTAIGTF